MLVHKPSKTGQWTASMPLAELVADAMPRKTGSDSLRTIGEMSYSDIVAVCTAVAAGLKKMLLQEVQHLDQAYKILDQSNVVGESSLSKFELFTMAGGNVQDFYSGLGARVGNFCRCLLVC